MYDVCMYVFMYVCMYVCVCVCVGMYVNCHNPESQLLTSTRLEEIDRCFGRNSVEEIFEALGREGTEWASKTLAKLKTMSPTSLKVNLLLFFLALF